MHYDLKPVPFTEIASVRPTIYVALGGSGTKTLMYLRRKLYANYRVPALPIQAFVFCDTDLNTANLSEADTVDVIEERIRPEERWMVDLSAPASEIRSVFENKGTYPHIHRWFPDERTSSYDILKNGAGQIRPNGKLAFWLRYDKFMRRLRDAYEEVRDPRNLQRTHDLFPGFEFDDRSVEFVIIAGLAGGTGSGAFLDAGMAIKLDERLGDAHVTGILFTADVYRSVRNMDPAFMQRNAFAALTELDGLMSGATPDRYLSTAFDWTGTGKAPTGADKPFDAIYLVGSSNREQVDYSSPIEVYEAVGEKLALEFDASEFGSKLRSIRSNALQHVRDRRMEWKNFEDADRNRLLFRDSYQSAYSSFGIAGIIYDRFNMRNVASALWLGKVFSYLLGRGMPEDEARLHAGKAAEGLGLAVERIWAAVLDEDGTPLDEAAVEPVRAELATARQRLLGAMARGEDEIGAANAALGALHSRFVVPLTAAGGPLKSGGQRDQIEANVLRFKRTAEEQLNRAFLQLLEDPERAGIPAAEAFLDRVKKELGRLEAELRQLVASDTQDPPRLERKRSQDGELEQALQRLDDARRIPAVFVPFRQVAETITAAEVQRLRSDETQRRERAFSAEFDAAGRLLLDQVRSRYRSTAARLLNSVVSALRGYVGTEETVVGADGRNEEVRSGLLRQLSEYRAGLQARERDAIQLMNAFDRRRQEYRNFVLTDTLDYEEASAEYLAARNNVRGIGERRDRRLAEDLFGVFLRRHSAGARVDEVDAGGNMGRFVTAACNHRLDAGKWTEVCHDLETHVRTQFEDFLVDRPLDAALSRDAAQEKKAINSQVDRKAMAFVQLYEGAAQFNIAGNDTLLYGRAADGGSATARKFLDANANAKSWSAVDLKSGSLVFYNEINGLPLLAMKTVWASESDFMAGVMENPEESYKRFSHKDWWMFRPIMPPKNDAEARENMEVSKLFWLGVCLNVVELEEGIGQRFRIQFHADSTQGWRKPHPLGASVDHAIIRLRQNPQRAGELRRAVNERRESLNEAQAKRLGAALHINWTTVFLPPVVQDDYAQQRRGGTGFRNLVFERLQEEHDAAMRQRGIESDFERIAHQLGAQLKRSTYRDYDTHGDIVIAL